mmetsp:Transcript_102752/g.299724  ORF Transcript_102752/g.299724 Transcript_102752/m.299724 type:complete len:206 (+) Transcript_102752:110-727(+)
MDGASLELKQFDECPFTCADRHLRDWGGLWGPCEGHSKRARPATPSMLVCQQALITTAFGPVACPCGCRGPESRHRAMQEEVRIQGCPCELESLELIKHHLYAMLPRGRNNPHRPHQPRGSTTSFRGRRLGARWPRRAREAPWGGSGWSLGQVRGLHAAPTRGRRSHPPHRRRELAARTSAVEVQPQIFPQLRTRMALAGSSPCG